MTFGGVATGSIKAQLQAKAKVTATVVEDKLSGILNVSMTGKTILAEAVFEASSVKKIVQIIKKAKINLGSMADSPILSWSAND